MKKITKAVIPAAGLGTRVLPATKAMPKGMLPLVDKPAIQYLVEEAVRSGITDILIIVSRNQDIIQDHFDRSLSWKQNLPLPARRRCWKSASASLIWPTSSLSASSRPSASATLSAWPSLHRRRPLRGHLR